MTEQQQQQHPHPNPSPPPPPTATASAAADPPPDKGISCTIPLIGLAFLTYNSIASILRSIDDPWTVAFVSFAYVDLLLLFYCFHLADRTPSGDLRRRAKLKAAVWSLAVVLTVMFAYRVAVIMPPFIAVLIWVLSALTIAGGFYVLFLFKEESEEEEEAKAAAGKKSSDAVDAGEKWRKLEEGRI